ncbi:hypothetical protein MHYP_G00171570 [Metynnis hypsauchen]
MTTPGCNDAAVLKSTQAQRAVLRLVHIFQPSNQISKRTPRLTRYWRWSSGVRAARRPSDWRRLATSPNLRWLQVPSDGLLVLPLFQEAGVFLSEAEVSRYLKTSRQLYGSLPRTSGFVYRPKPCSSAPLQRVSEDPQLVQCKCRSETRGFLQWRNSEEKKSGGSSLSDVLLSRVPARSRRRRRRRSPRSVFDRPLHLHVAASGHKHQPPDRVHQTVESQQSTEGSAD